MKTYKTKSQEKFQMQINNLCPIFILLLAIYFHLFCAFGRSPSAHPNSGQTVLTATHKLAAPTWLRSTFNPTSRTFLSSSIPRNKFAVCCDWIKHNRTLEAGVLLLFCSSWKCFFVFPRLGILSHWYAPVIKKQGKSDRRLRVLLDEKLFTW